MVPTTPIAKRCWIFAAVLTAAFFVQSLTSSLLKSPTFDETAQIAAGLSYWQTGSPRRSVPPGSLRMEGRDAITRASLNGSANHTFFLVGVGLHF